MTLDGKRRYGLLYRKRKKGGLDMPTTYIKKTAFGRKTPTSLSQRRELSDFQKKKVVKSPLGRSPFCRREGKMEVREDSNSLGEKRNLGEEKGKSPARKKKA